MSHLNLKPSRNITRDPESLSQEIARDKVRTLTTYRLKEREIKHVRITNSEQLQNSYSFGKQIGQGAFGTVISVRDKTNDVSWAMKVVNKEALGKQLPAIHREIQILKMVEHPHIIYLHQVFESVKKIYMVLERCYGTLSNVFEKIKPFSESDTRKVVTDLILAVAYLHKNDIVHRDLKLENILIAKNPDDDRDKLYIKLTDFGLSIVKKGSSYEDMLHDCCGTLLYMAPEIIKTHSYSQLCDVWAVGVIMYALLRGEHPFKSISDEALKNQICNNNPEYSDFNCSAEAIHLITKMLKKNPALRITAAEASSHPWIVGKPKTTDETDNVLDMMRLWRSEMMLPVGEESDWVSSAKAAGSNVEISSNSPSREFSTHAINKAKLQSKVENIEGQKPPRTTYRETMRLPVKNIRFNEAFVKADDKLRTTGGVGKLAPGGGAAANQQQTSGRSTPMAPPTASTSKRR